MGFCLERNSPVIGTDLLEWVDCSVDRSPVGSAEGIVLGEILTILPLLTLVWPSTFLPPWMS
jgi:hypothetical protein